MRPTAGQRLKVANAKVVNNLNKFEKIAAGESQQLFFYLL